MSLQQSQKLRTSLERFSDILSDQDIEEILAIQDQPLSPGIRLNQLKVDPQEEIERLAEFYNWKVQPIPFCEQGWTILEAVESPGTTIEHRMGQYYLQDAASMVPVSIFEFRESHPLILDMAASPGGKTTHLIDRSGDHGFIIANDSSKGRIPALRSVLTNWGGINRIITQYPGELFGEWFPETFDMILLDAPCSMENLRPTPSHPLRETTADERLRLQERQVQLLMSALSALKVGGQLVYATCSLAPEEDEAVFQKVIDAFPGSFMIQDAALKFPYQAPGLTQFGGEKFHPDLAHTLRLWPHLKGMSGFYCGLLVKTKPTTFRQSEPPARDLEKTDLSPLSAIIQKNVIDVILGQYGFQLDVLLNQYHLALHKRFDQLFLIPETYLKQFPTLPFEQIGMQLGQWQNGQFRPSHEFVSRFGHHFTGGKIVLENDEAVVQWIAGRDIRHPITDMPAQGQYLLVSDVHNRNLGIGKLLPKRLRNMLPRQSI